MHDQSGTWKLYRREVRRDSRVNIGPSFSMTAALYWLSMALILLWYVLRVRRHHAESLAARNRAIEAGMTEPASLHPSIDPLKCTGCGACIAACPEQPAHKVLGLIRGKAELVGPTECIGHGACLAACPHDAITLVFGTERRGIDIPHIGANFETNVTGLFIAGELGGMGLIRNAIEQGRQAVTYICAGLEEDHGLERDLVIVGAGPAGFSAALAATERGIRFLAIEQDSLGGTVAHYPRRKLVMTQPADLPLVGKVSFRETSKEDLLEFWQRVERDTGVRLRCGERLERIESLEPGFRVLTSRREVTTRSVLLAIGRRGTPRTLGVPGEDLAKVTYRLVDPDQYRGLRVLVVGGGDSAVEAACALADVADTVVTLSYRSEALTRAKPRNREALDGLEARGRVAVLLESEVQSIGEGSVTLEQRGRTLDLPNDAVIINAGGVLPTQFLRSLGVHVETKFGTA